MTTRSYNCPVCRYDLREQSTNAEVRCPECGRACSAAEIDDHGVLQAYVAPYAARWKGLLLVSIIFPAVIANGLFWPAAMHWWLDDWPTWMNVIFFGFALTVAVTHLLIGCITGHLMLRAWSWWGGLIVGVLLTVLALGAFYAIAFTISFIYV